MKPPSSQELNQLIMRNWLNRIAGNNAVAAALIVACALLLLVRNRLDSVLGNIPSYLYDIGGLVFLFAGLILLLASILPQETGEHAAPTGSKVEEPVSSSQDFVRKMTKMIPQVMYVFDITKGRNIYANRQIARDLGYNPEEIQDMGGSFLPKLLHPDDLLRLPEILARWKTATDGEILELEYRMKHRNGDWHWFMAKDTVFSRDAQGSVRQILGIAQDITERKKAENELRQSEERWRTVIQNVPNYVLILDREHRIRFINYVGDERDADQVIGTTVHEFVREDFRPQYESLLESVFQTGEPAALEMICQGENPGTWCWYQTRIAPLKYAGGVESALVVASDISPQKQHEEQILASLREKDVLLQEVHHRVKNNLQVITSLLNLQASQTTHADVHAFFQETQSRVRSIALIHELLYQTPNLADLDLGDYVSTLCRHLYRTYAAGEDRIALQIDVAVKTLDLDRAIPMGLIINEVVSNSLKHAFPNGRQGAIDISIGMAKEHEVVMKISDNGVGLPEGFIEGSVTSLGLRLVADLAKQLKGKMQMERALGTKTVVRFPTKSGTK